MRAFRIPRQLHDAATRDPNPGRRTWVSALPDVVGELSRRWELDVGLPFEPGGQCAWVAPVTNARGEELVLKVGWRHPEAEHEAEGLRFWSGTGTALLHAFERLDGTDALLLERCTPGVALKHSMPEPAQDEVIASILTRLWQPPHEGHRFPALAEMCDQWAGAFESALPHTALKIDPGIAHEGMALLRALPRSANAGVVLCTDLHGDNVLSAQREPWLVVDPKPHVGDPAYDVLQHILNCRDRLAADPQGLARRLARLADVDPERVRLWLFARCVQESIESPSLYEVAARLASSL